MKEKYASQATSIRLPEGFKSAVDLFLRVLNEKTGTHITRSEFMVMSTKFYLKYLLDAHGIEDIGERIIEFKNKRLQLPKNKTQMADIIK